MKILTYSDLHLEIGHSWTILPGVDGDLLVLAGDIISLKNYKPLVELLQAWQKPVLYVLGNHEYYTRRPMDSEEDVFKQWLNRYHPNVKLLLDRPVNINGVNFFGGTMWTDFNDNDSSAKRIAASAMNDFRLIYNSNSTAFSPTNAVILHRRFVSSLTRWLRMPLDGPRVVITHHAPVIKANSKYRSSPLQPAFNSLDMLEIIKKYQPNLWIYGHTHECDDQTIGRTRLISNQQGYCIDGKLECADFDPLGQPITL